MNCGNCVQGTITVRIHEADGTPYEHVLDIRAPQKHYEVLFNTKYKRVRRNTKRYISRKAAALAAAQGDSEAMEDISLLNEAFTLPLWEDDNERAKWKVADWTEEDEQRMAGATYEWIRMDADFEWIGDIAFDQPDFMWVSQLQRDRDVVAQLEVRAAVEGAQLKLLTSGYSPAGFASPSEATIRHCLQFSDAHCFGLELLLPCSDGSSFAAHSGRFNELAVERLWIDLVLSVSQCALEDLQFVGIFHLLKIFTAWCYEPQQRRHEFGTRFIPRPNDFSNIPDYFVRKVGGSCVFSEI